MWEAIYKAYEKHAVAPRYITDPSPLEDGYKSVNIRNIVDSTWVPYVTMKDFTGSIGDCEPVAATNLMIIANHSFGENALDETIQQVYDKLFDATECDPVEGTYPNKLSSGIDSYLTSIKPKYAGATGRYQWVEDIGLNGMMSNVKNQICQIIQLNKKSLYGSHYVYAFGYEEYVHTNKTNVYFMIADGWNSGVRYIQFDADKMHTVVTVEF